MSYPNDIMLRRLLALILCNLQWREAALSKEELVIKYQPALPGLARETPVDHVLGDIEARVEW
jgi:hypothetical protein